MPDGPQARPTQGASRCQRSLSWTSRHIASTVAGSLLARSLHGTSGTPVLLAGKTNMPCSARAMAEGRAEDTTRLIFLSCYPITTRENRFFLRGR
jgi:hypothetical protein